MSLSLLIVGIISVVTLICAAGWTFEMLEPQWFQVKGVDVESMREQARREGLVLHRPSYENGTECYVEPKWQYHTNVIRSHTLHSALSSSVARNLSVATSILT